MDEPGDFIIRPAVARQIVHAFAAHRAHSIGSAAGGRRDLDLIRPVVALRGWLYTVQPSENRAFRAISCALNRGDDDARAPLPNLFRRGKHAAGGRDDRAKQESG
jgi:hypothetical protein